MPKKQTAFELEIRDDNVAVVRMNVPGEAHNVLKAEFTDEFEDLFRQLKGNGQLKAVVFGSSKPGSFLAGADIKLFENVSTAKEIEDLSRQLHAALQEMEDLPVPVVAAIDGACLGGGLELVLACDARVASDSPKTVLGLPEVMLGLLPAGGGTQRLPNLIGIRAALDLMLTGKQVRPVKAKKLGIVDKVVAPEAIIDAAIAHAKKLASDKPGKNRGLASRIGDLMALPSSLQDKALDVALEENFAGRKVLFSQARQQVYKQTRGNYPAPEKIIDCVAEGAARGMKAGLALEAKAFGELVFTPQSKALRHVYRATEDLKRETFVADGVEPRKINHVGVLGAGLMGSGIATVTINKAGLDVRLKDKDNDGLARGLGAVRGFYDKRVKRKVMSRYDAERDLHRVTGTTGYDGFKGADMVIEAVFEDLDLKHRMLADVEALGNESTIFASNTSSIPITDIAAKAKRPENVIGLHYFSPVEKMPLLEIIATEDTAPEVIAASVKFGKAQGKTIIVVKDGPGFYTTRILAPFLNEATRILSEGVEIRAVDKALKDYGFPVGPITLMDEVGIDVGTKIGPILEKAFGERTAVPGDANKMIEAGYAGRKTGKGFYVYDGKKSKGAKPVNTAVYKLMGVSADNHKQMDATEIAERCTLMMLNEAAYCLGDGIITDPMHGDIGAIFGLGFPPFTGGPFRFADQLGAQAVVDKLDKYAGRYGERFKPAPALVEAAKKGKPFYPEKKATTRRRKAKAS